MNLAPHVRRTVGVGVEGLDIPLAELRRLPFFAQLDHCVLRLLDRTGQSHELSYVVWGGVAANLLLQLLGVTRTFYSVHDIELFFVRRGEVHDNDRLCRLLDAELSSDSRFGFSVGGSGIIRSLGTVTWDHFQLARIRLPDGDLQLNNVAICIDRLLGRALITGPEGTLCSLVNGDRNLELKPAQGIVTIDRLARRISRTVAKVMRLETVSPLKLSSTGNAQIVSFLDQFIHKATDNRPEPATTAWLNERDLRDGSEARRWLYGLIVSETAKRMAALHGISSAVPTDFSRWLIGERALTSVTLSNPLVEGCRALLLGRAWTPRPDMIAALGRRCLRDFQLYQKPGAERLVATYSI
jgi:hypothetical protein